jgi:uncharacterized protein (TIGR00730 family)
MRKDTYRIMVIKSLTIFCSSSNSLSEDYYIMAEDLGKFLYSKSITIIYGGGKVGLMGRVSSSSYNMGGKVIGIIPKFLNSKEKINTQTTETIIVKDMPDRKKKLFEMGDAFLILPGGSGTIEEAAEVISWKFLGLHNKKIILFNYKKYWDPIINMYDQAEKNNFGIKSLHNICDLVNTLQEFKKIFP